MSAVLPTPGDRIRAVWPDLADSEVAAKAATLADHGGDMYPYLVGAFEELAALAAETWERCDDEEVGKVLRRLAVLVLAREATR